MKIIEKAVLLDRLCSLELTGLRREDAVFFDIETTGLSAYRSSLYLIGALVWEEGWKLYQYFSEGMEDEIPVLQAFSSLCRGKKQLVSFNGEGFDIPYLQKLLQQYEMADIFGDLESFDILRELRPGKRLLRLPSYKLKKCEEYLGICREDRYSGGELIGVYQSYLLDRDPAKLQLLLLHNEEDLRNLPLVLPILCYGRLLEGAMPLHFMYASAVGGEACLELHFETEEYFPVPLDFDISEGKDRTAGQMTHGEVRLMLDGRELTLSITLVKEEMKFFYENPRDYYYLPEEDMAVHKSVGEFVDRAHRKQATAQTAYQRKSGIFLPDPEEMLSPSFRRSYRDRLSYAEYKEGMFEEREAAERYLRGMLQLV